MKDEQIVLFKMEVGKIFKKKKIFEKKKHLSFSWTNEWYYSAMA